MLIKSFWANTFWLILAVSIVLPAVRYQAEAIPAPSPEQDVCHTEDDEIVSVSDSDFHQQTSCQTEDDEATSQIENDEVISDTNDINDCGNISTQLKLNIPFKSPLVRLGNIRASMCF